MSDVKTTSLATFARSIGGSIGVAVFGTVFNNRLAANLRRAFSGIVTGNVKENGVAAIERLGPYELSGDADIMRLLDELLTGFVAQGRTKLPGSAYRPCYRLVA